MRSFGRFRRRTASSYTCGAGLKIFSSSTLSTASKRSPELRTSGSSRSGEPLDRMARFIFMRSSAAGTSGNGSSRRYSDNSASIRSTLSSSPSAAQA